MRRQGIGFVAFFSLLVFGLYLEKESGQSFVGPSTCNLLIFGLVTSLV